MSEQATQEQKEKRIKLSLVSVIGIIGLLVAIVTIFWTLQSTLCQSRIGVLQERIELLQDKLKMAGEKYYVEKKSNQIDKQSSIVPNKYFTFYSIQNGDKLNINDNINIDGFLRNSNFNPKIEFIWLFFKLNDNYYIKPNSRASFDSNYWSTTLLLDSHYESIVAFKVNSEGDELFVEWSKSRFGGIKRNEFPLDAVQLGKVVINPTEKN